MVDENQEPEPKTPEEIIAWTMRYLKKQAKVVDEHAASLELEWEHDDLGEMTEPFMETITYADGDGYRVYAAEVTEEKLLATPEAEGQKVSWSLFKMPEHEDLVGGPAESIAQAQRFAELAYQAAHGVIRGRDA